jgi:hypothetical protein
VQQDAEQISQRPVVRVEIGLLVPDHGRAADQRLDRIEDVANVLDRIDPETLDELLGIGAGNRVVRQVGYRDDREKDRHGQQHEQGQNAGPQPQFSREDACHARPVPASKSQIRETNRRPNAPSGMRYIIAEISSVGASCL